MRLSYLADDTWGYLTTVQPSLGNSAVNTANTYVGHSFNFRGSSAKNMNSFRTYLASASGVVASDIRLDIYGGDLLNIAPDMGGGSLANATASSASAGWIDFTGFSVSLSPHLPYWAVIRNLNASPTVNTFTLRASANGGGAASVNPFTGYMSWLRKTSTNAGSTWGGGSNVIGYRIGFDDGSYMGLPIQDGGNDTTNRVYADRMVGSKFTTPSNVKLNAIGIALVLSKSGSPTGHPVFKLYEGTTLVATTGQFASNTAIIGATIGNAFFTAPVTLKANTTYRAVIAETTQSDTSSNYYMGIRYIMDTDAASMALKPCNGTIEKTYFDGSSWTDTNTEFIPFCLFLDTDDNFSYNGTDPVTAGQVKTGESIVVNGTTVNGTYDGSDRWTDPGEANVRNGTAYKANSTTNNKTGTVAIPGASHVRSGTAIDATTGTLVVPIAANVRDGVSVDATTGTLVVPADDDVRDGVTFDNGTVGLLDLPAESDVVEGVIYDNGTKEGTATGSMSPEDIADAVWGANTADYVASGTFGLLVQKMNAVLKFLGVK